MAQIQTRENNPTLYDTLLNLPQIRFHHFQSPQFQQFPRILRLHIQRRRPISATAAVISVSNGG